MPTYEVMFKVPVEVIVEIDVPDEDTASDQGWEIAEEYCQTLGVQVGDPRITHVHGSLDGIGAHTVEEKV